MNSDSRQPDAGSTSQARHPALLAHQQQQQQQPPARGNSLFEEVQWAPALKDALPSPSLAATSSASNELSLRQSSLDALNKYNTQAAVLQHDLYGQNPGSSRSMLLCASCLKRCFFSPL